MGALLLLAPADGRTVVKSFTPSLSATSIAAFKSTFSTPDVKNLMPASHAFASEVLPDMIQLKGPVIVSQSASQAPNVMSEKIPASHAMLVVKTVQLASVWPQQALAAHLWPAGVNRSFNDQCTPAPALSRTNFTPSLQLGNLQTPTASSTMSLQFGGVGHSAQVFGGHATHIFTSPTASHQVDRHGLSTSLSKWPNAPKPALDTNILR